MKWRDGDGYLVDCFCGWYLDAACLTVEEISTLMREHCLSIPDTHTWNEPSRGKFVGESIGLFVDDAGELWQRGGKGWEFVATPTRSGQ